ncbi:MFS transporter [Microbacterium sp. GXF7504]
MTTADAALELGRIRRRTLWALSLGQILGGIAFGATISLGAVIVAEVSGDESLSGLAAAGVTLGAAAFAVPLAALARTRGRRPALVLGLCLALVGVGGVVAGTGLGMLPLLLAGIVCIGAGQAANLQSRFAAADLATDRSRGRDISVVVWATTIGAVLGPNLVGPGEVLGGWLGMPPLTGPYAFTVAAQVLAVGMYLVLLRPDPLVIATRIARGAAAAAGGVVAGVDRPVTARVAIAAIAGAHGVMVAVMAMTPVHLLHHGAALTVVGLTISLHIAGMYALSPVFGFLADRWGRIRVIVLGQLLLAASLCTVWLGAESQSAVTVGLVVLGLGWSAVTVAGAALLTEASAQALRTKRQGRSDLTMNLVGAAASIAAGAVLALIGYGGLALAALVVVAVVLALLPLARR